MLQNIINNIKKQNWMRACANSKINKWDLIDLAKEIVYVSTTNPIPTKVRNCRKCGTEFNIRVVKDVCYLKPVCNCAKDGTHLMTLTKLETMLLPEEAQEFYSKTSLAKRKGLKNTKECWLIQGLTEIEATNKVKEVQLSRSRRSPAAQKGARYTNRTIEYWIKKGFTAAEAVSKVKETQIKNGIKWYIDQYGEQEGTNKFNQRIEQWLNAPGNKNMTRGRSKHSMKLFESLGIDGSFGENEKSIRGATRVHRVDFLFGKKLIEYYGDYWHANPLIYDRESAVKSKVAENIWAHDAAKINDLIAKGYEVMIIWERDYITNADAVVTKCKEFLREN